MGKCLPLEQIKLIFIYLSFKVWRLTGELIYEYKTKENQELWQVLWQPGTFARGQRQAIKSDDGSTPGKRMQIVIIRLNS